MKTEPTILIARYLQKTIAADEETQLLEWINESQANKKEFEDFVSIWEMTGNPPLEPFTTHEEWEKLSDKLNLSTANVQYEQTQMPLNTYRYWLIGTAATISLAIIIYFAIPTTINSIRIIETVATDGNQTKEVKLPDGSVVWLNTQSQISFVKDFDNGSREISLQGEAFFEVKKDEQKPFTVRTGATVTRVIGTSFNIKSTPTHDTVAITVVGGKVKFFNNLSPEKSIMLYAGTKGIYIAATDSIYSLENDDPNVLSWQNNRLVFKDLPVKDVIVVLNHHYGVDIKAMDEAILLCKFTSTFENASIEEILNILSLSLDLGYYRDGHGYFLKGKGCN